MRFRPRHRLVARHVARNLHTSFPPRVGPTATSTTYVWSEPSPLYTSNSTCRQSPTGTSPKSGPPSTLTSAHAAVILAAAHRASTGPAAGPPTAPPAAAAPACEPAEEADADAHSGGRRGSMPRQTDRLWVTDRYGRYLGELSLRLLLTNSSDTLVSDISLRKIEPLHVLTTQREVARVFEDFDLVSAPVVDDNNRLIGRVTIDDVVDVIREEAEQSVMSMAGLNQEDDIFAPILRSTRKRALWLGVNLLTALLASWVIAQFEGTLERIVTLAVLMSVVPSMGGIAGSQTLTLVIRGQALNQINKSNLRDLLTREVAIGLLNGVLWALIIAGLVWLWFGDQQIGMIIGAALIVNLVTAAYAGAMLPMLMRRLGIDPALAGGVALTTVTDVVGLVAFLGLATLIL